VYFGVFLTENIIFYSCKGIIGNLIASNLITSNL